MVYLREITSSWNELPIDASSGYSKQILRMCGEINNLASLAHFFS